MNRIAKSEQLCQALRVNGYRDRYRWELAGLNFMGVILYTLRCNRIHLRKDRL